MKPEPGLPVPYLLAGAALLLFVVVAGAAIMTVGPRGDEVAPPASLKPPAPERILVEDVTLADQPGWSQATMVPAVGAFVCSCDAILPRADTAPMMPRPAAKAPFLRDRFGTVADWRPACTAASTLMAASSLDDEAARAFFEAYFVGLRVRSSKPEAAGLFTGYFEPTYPATDAPEGQMTAPVLTRPPAMIEVDLGAFDEGFAGRRIKGRVEGTRLVPYFDHGEIAAGAIGGADVLAYVDPNDLLFLQIQGSGRLEYLDGRVERVGYADQNGHDYVAIGRTLVRDGEMPLAAVTMQSIRAWLTDAPDARAAAVRHSNPSYVFFRRLTDLPAPDLGPLGAQGVQLTPQASLAIDPRFTPYGAPVLLTLFPRGEEGRELGPAGVAGVEHHFLVAQDTGGAIKGAQRGDVFFGAGADAAVRAGALKAPGEMVVLVPKGIEPATIGRGEDDPS